MRLTPAQIDFHFICGSRPGWFVDVTSEMTLAELIWAGRQGLLKLTQQDFEYDLLEWHEYLLRTEEEGYGFNQGRGFPGLAKEAMASLEWREAVASLRQQAHQVADRADRDSLAG